MASAASLIRLQPSCQRFRRRDRPHVDRSPVVARATASVFADGATAAGLVAAYSRATGRAWRQQLGFVHSLWEAGFAALGACGDPHDSALLAETLASLEVDTLVGRSRGARPVTGPPPCLFSAGNGEPTAHRAGRSFLSRHPIPPVRCSLRPGSS